MTHPESGDARELVGQQLGAYQIEEPLEIGGQSDLFRARDLYTDHLVAFKLLPATLSTSRESVARMRDEARRTARLRHPHLLPIAEVSVERGLLFAVALLPIASLRDRFERDGLLSPPTAVRYAAELAWALHALHGAGLVHGDIQPANMLFDTQGGLRLADFGEARALARQRGKAAHPTAPSRPLAERSYIAPEVAQGGEITPRSDIYALGAVFYEMLIGTLPLIAPDGDLSEEITTAPLPPSMRSSEDWPELAAVALKALAPDPARRYADARAFAVALRTAVFTQQREDQRPSLIAALSGVFHAPSDGAEATFIQRITGAPAPAAPMPGGDYAGPLDAPHLAYRAASPHEAPPQPESAPEGGDADESATAMLGKRRGVPDVQLPDTEGAPAAEAAARDTDEATTTQLDRRLLGRQREAPPKGMPLPPPSVPPRPDDSIDGDDRDADEVDLAAAWLAALERTATPAVIHAPAPSPEAPDSPESLETLEPPESPETLQSLQSLESREPPEDRDDAQPPASAPTSLDAPAAEDEDEDEETADAEPMQPEELVEDLRRLADEPEQRAGARRTKRANPGWVKALLATLGVTALAAVSGLGILSSAHTPNAAPGGPAIPTATTAPAYTTSVATPAATHPPTRPGNAHGSTYLFPTPTPIPPPPTATP